MKTKTDIDTIDSLILEIQEIRIRMESWPSGPNPLDKRELPEELVWRHTEVLAQLYQARALNEIAQSLYELVRDGIGVKRDDQ